MKNKYHNQQGGDYSDVSQMFVSNHFIFSSLADILK